MVLSSNEYDIDMMKWSKRNKENKKMVHQTQRHETTYYLPPDNLYYLIPKSSSDCKIEQNAWVEESSL